MAGSMGRLEVLRVSDRGHRTHLLEEWERRWEKPILFLSLVWLTVLIVEMARGANAVLSAVGTVIWVIFLLEFMVEIWLAPDKVRHLKKNWIVLLSLLAPPLRILRVASFFRVARLGRGFSMLRMVSSLNRSMRVLGSTMERRRVGYVFVLTMLVLFAGAAGMLAFEKDVPLPTGIHNYGSALWWTAMLMTSIGSEYWPRTVEGRSLCVVLAVYGFAVFGYLTATLASLFVDQDADDENAAVAGQKKLEEIQVELRALRAALESQNKK